MTTKIIIFDRDNEGAFEEFRQLSNIHDVTFLMEEKRTTKYLWLITKSVTYTLVMSGEGKSIENLMRQWLLLTSSMRFLSVETLIGKSIA